MHTVEKIGGTSMSDYASVRDNIILKPANADTLYQRIFVVSAYGGITDKLLEHKKSGKPGVFALFAGSMEDKSWLDALQDVRDEMFGINASLFEDKAELKKANEFICTVCVCMVTSHWSRTCGRCVKCWPVWVRRTVPGIWRTCYNVMGSMPAMWI